MTSKEILQELEGLKNEQYRKIFMNHGAPPSVLGVKVEYLKQIMKRTKKNHALSLELYDSGVSDAMYLAGLIADEKKITREQLQDWVEKATWYMLCEYTVAWVAAESPYGYELGKSWIKSDREMTACAGWSTLSSWLSITPAEQVDPEEVRGWIDRVVRDIHQAPNRVRYVMNGLVIAAGSFVPELTEYAIAAGKKIGKVHVDMGGTACKVPSITDYILKVKDKGYIGRKKKMARC